MKKQVQSFDIGNGRRLVLETDPDNEQEQKFIKECQEVDKTKPKNLQDFFTTLINIQKRNDRIVAEDNDDSIKGISKKR